MLFDKIDAIPNYKEIEKLKEMIKIAKQIYEAGDVETRTYLEKVRLSAFLKEKH